MDIEMKQKVVDDKPRMKTIKLKLDYKNLEAKIKFVSYKEEEDSKDITEEQINE